MRPIGPIHADQYLGTSGRTRCELIAHDNSRHGWSPGGEDPAHLLLSGPSCPDIREVFQVIGHGSKRLPMFGIQPVHERHVPSSSLVRIIAATV